MLGESRDDKWISFNHPWLRDFPSSQSFKTLTNTYCCLFNWINKHWRFIARHIYSPLMILPWDSINISPNCFCTSLLLCLKRNWERLQRHRKWHQKKNYVVKNFRELIIIVDKMYLKLNGHGLPMKLLLNSVGETKNQGAFHYNEIDITEWLTIST